MTPAARVQSAIELLDGIIVAARDDGPAADTLIARHFKTRRYAGSKDRRAVRELVYRAIRALGERPASGRAAMVALADTDADLAALFDGVGHGAAPIMPEEPRAALGLLPGWLAPELATILDDADKTALLDRAPLHIRARPDSIDAVRALWPEATAIPGTGAGFALPAGSDVEGSALWQSGMVEIQDAGSQIISRACGAAPGLTVLDLCAGGGGKTLALAADMAPADGARGRLIAADTARDRLARLTPRAARAGIAALIETLLLDPHREREALAPFVGACDIVLIDAPCSGSGTWRRNPEARWRLNPERLARTVALQARLLGIAAPLVKPGGRLFTRSAR